MASLPYPEPAGNIEDLRPFINFATEADWILLVSWILPIGAMVLLWVFLSRRLGATGQAVMNMAVPLDGEMVEAYPEDYFKGE